MTTNLHIEGPRDCTKADLPELIDLVNAVFRSDGRQDILTDYPLVYRDGNLRNIRLIKVEGQVVSEVPFIPWRVEHEGCRFTVGFISPTATHPDYRHQGYGLQCLKSCIACMNEQGVDLSVLWTVVPTFKFYHHADYQAVDQQGWIYDCSRLDASLFHGHGEQIETYDPGTRRYLRELQTIRHAGSPGVMRDDDQTATLLALPNQKTLLAMRGDQPAAYLTVSRSTNKPGIIEAHGDAGALETLFRHSLTEVLSELRMETVQIFAHRCPSGLGSLLERVLPERRQTTNSDQMMVRINDIASFLIGITPWLEHRNDGQTHAFSIAVGEETVSLDFTTNGLIVGTERHARHLTLSRLELTSAIFGAHAECPFDPPAELARPFPFSFPISVLDRS